ncbi:Ppx/GppA phosphatase family protein [Psychromonas algicola]|uniref:Ppx/GppA phosphatase family protein n=1 Tax=Psychromonas algicola TaxID=2555642 RepID=UPI0010680F72|nr:exopolyphosphatase [Psychromonas sp. RZ5]TEW48266.1 exopolyphosphatase [Psychromonas sp. RZ5]
MSGERYLAAIDLGSNSFHLVIARELTGCIQTVLTKKSSVRLASGLDKNLYLSEKAMQRGLDCLAEFKKQLTGVVCQDVSVVATYTLRVAKNRAEFLDRAKKIFPYPIKIISGENEAKLIYQGVAHTYPIKGTTLVVDIGGGSTELIIGKRFRTKFTKSIEIGSRSFSKRYFSDGIVTEKTMRLAQAGARKALLPILAECTAIGWKSVLGTSGSFKSIKQIMLEIYGDSHITEKRVRRLIQRFIKSKNGDNIRLESLELSRFVIIASALSIISSLMDLFAIKEIEVSSAALREGVLYGLNNTQEDIAPRDRTVNNLLDLHNVDQVFSKRVLLQLQLFNEQLIAQNNKLSDSAFMFLQYASLLHEIGLNINSKKRQKHGAYILENSTMPGFSEQEQQIISSMVGHHRGKIDFIKSFDLLTQEKYLQLIQLLRLAIILTMGRREFPLQSTKISYHGQELHMILPASLFKNGEFFGLLEKEIALQRKAGLSLKVISDPIEL